MSTNAQKKQLTKGKVVSQKQSIDVDFEQLSETDRSVLLMYCTLYNDELFLTMGSYLNYSESRTDKHWSCVEIDAFELEEILTHLRQKKDNSDAKEIEKNKEKQKKENEIKEAVAANRNKFLNNRDAVIKLISQSFYTPVCTHTDNIDNDTKEYIRQIENELKLEKQQQKQEAEKVKENMKENLRQWALQNGTPLIKARIEENMNWISLANDEYFASILPEGFVCLKVPDEDWLIYNATLEQIEELRKVRVDYPDARLERYKYVTKGDREYEEDDSIEHKDVISIKLTSFDGSFIKFEKVLSEETVENND